MLSCKFPEWIVAQSKTTPIPYDGFEVTEQSSMYSLLPFQISQVGFFLKKYMPQLSTIVDGTSHVGCDVIHMANLYYGATIYAYEMDNDVYNLLVKNIQYYTKYFRWDGEKIHSTHQDFTTVKKFQTDLLYLDPPWGGKEYKEMKEVSLYLSGIPVQQIIADWLDNGYAQYVVLKAPFNFNVKDLDHFRSKKYSIVYQFIYTPGRKISYTLFFITKLK